MGEKENLSIFPGILRKTGVNDRCLQLAVFLSITVAQIMMHRYSEILIPVSLQKGQGSGIMSPVKWGKLRTERKREVELFGRKEFNKIRISEK